MAVTIKTHREIDLMRESCKILAKVHEELGYQIFYIITVIRHQSVCR